MYSTVIPKLIVEATLKGNTLIKHVSEGLVKHKEQLTNDSMCQPWLKYLENAIANENKVIDHEMEEYAAAYEQIKHHGPTVDTDENEPLEPPSSTPGSKIDSHSDTVGEQTVPDRIDNGDIKSADEELQVSYKVKVSATTNFIAFAIKLTRKLKKVTGTKILDGYHYDLAHRTEMKKIVEATLKGNCAVIEKVKEALKNKRNFYAQSEDTKHWLKYFDDFLANLEKRRRLANTPFGKLRRLLNLD